MSFNGRYHKGYMRTVRQLKREEAEARNRKKEENETHTAVVLQGREPGTDDVHGDSPSEDR